ncbi:MAG: aminotransferase class I/II-fold pyridoxal phosphate-dependent enzyme [Candidatus Zixiibacteriota bacterium]
MKPDDKTRKENTAVKSSAQRRGRQYGSPEIIHHPSTRVRQALLEYRERLDTRREAVATGEDLLAALSRFTGLPRKCLLTFGDISLAFEAILKRYARPGSVILAAGPAGDRFRLAAESCNINLYSHYGVSPFTADPEGLVEKVTDNTDFLYIQNPARPTGALYNLDELEYILERLDDTIMILDESYIEYSGLTATALLQKFNNLIIVRTLSEAFNLVGLACSYILATPLRIDEVSVQKPERAPYIMAEIAAAAVLNDFEFLQNRVERINENLVYLSVRLRRLGVSCRITPADLLLMRVIDSPSVLSTLRKAGIFAFDFGYLPQMENYIGLAVTEDTAVGKIAETFELMPCEFYRSQTVSNGKITFHRGAEEKASVSNIVDTK